MADQDAQEKAEKVAAAKKRYEQIKKQNAKSKKGGAVKKKEEAKAKDSANPADVAPDEDGIEQEAAEMKADTSRDEPEGQLETVEDLLEGDIAPRTDQKEKNARKPSVSVESRMRSESFRRSSVTKSPLSPAANGPKSPTLPALNPDGESMTEIYRKQALRVDELEKENHKLAKEAREAEGRWRALESELEDIRESSSGNADLRSKAIKVDALEEELSKLKLETTSLQRQNSRLQSQKSSRHSSSPSTVTSSSPSTDLQAQLESKQATIESMELELSTLRAQILKSSTDTHTEQVSALEEKLSRAESAAGAAQRELLDLRKNLDRASEKAVKEGTERISIVTKLKSLEREAAGSKKSAEDSISRVETLEKKLSTLTTLHKESDTRRQAGDRTRDRLENEVANLRRRSAALENENLRLREERERLRRRDAGATDDDGLDELEDEERTRLQTHIRGLESEVSDLRRGIWREKRRELDNTEGGEGAPGSPGANKFDEIDLSGPSPSFLQSNYNRRPSMAQTRGSTNFTNVLTSGFNALTSGIALGGNNRNDGEADDGLLPDEDFDEDIYRRAQEDEARKEKDRLDGIKSELKKWKGWRMDIVGSRLGTVGREGMGEIFEI